MIPNITSEEIEEAKEESTFFCSRQFWLNVLGVCFCGNTSLPLQWWESRTHCVAKLTLEN